MNFRQIQQQDTDKASKFILKHGANQWNDISKESIDRQLKRIAQGEYFGLFAEVQGEWAGVLLTTSANKFSKYLSVKNKDYKIGNISEVVIGSPFAGQGIGTKILKEAMIIFKDKAVKSIYAERHEENIGSARIMEKVGFKVIDTFKDYPRRQTGSKKTCITRVKI